MTSLWDGLPAALQGDHSVDSIADLVQAIDGQGTGPVAATDNNGTAVQRRTGHFAPTSLTNLTFDPLSGQFSHDGSSTPSSSVSPTSWLTFPDLAIDWVLDTYASGEVALYLTLPSAVLTLPFLRGAKLDSNNLLIADDAHPTVHFILPRLTLKLDWNGPGQSAVRLISASTVPGSTGTENVFQLCRMDPPHALVGPGTVFGFTFDSAELYLDADPPGLPAAAHGAPTPWQGIHLPNVHIYVAPEGMQSVAVAAGVRDLYVGFGAHSGVTGEFDVLVIQRGQAPTVSLSFIDDQGHTQQIADGDATAAVAAHGHLVVLLTSSIAPYTTTITVAGSAPTTSGYVATPVEVSVAAAGTAVTITASGASGGPTTRVITLTQAAPTGATTQTDGISLSDARLRIVSSDDTTVTLGPTDTTITSLDWTWDGGGASTGATAIIPLAAGAQVSVSANYGTTGVHDLDVFYRYDHPKVGEDGVDSTASTFPFSNSAPNTHTTEAANSDDAAQWTVDGQDVAANTAIQQRLTALPNGATVTVTGFASYDANDGSYDTPAHRDWNDRLANRRAAGVASLLTSLSGRGDLTFTPSHVTEGSGQGFAASRADMGTARSHYWRATAAGIPLGASETITAVVSRGTPTPRPTPRDAPPANPSWFRKLQIQLVLQRSRFVSLKILGEVDFYTATEQQLSHAETPQHLPTRPDNSMDGVTDMTLEIRVDDAAATWSVDASFRAVDQDTDGLWTLYRPTAGATTVVDMVGAYAALSPVLAAVAPASPSNGDVVPLVIASAAVLGLAAAGILPVKQVTLHGVEVLVSSSAAGTQVDLIVDVETSIGLQAEIVSIDLSNPVKVRYKAVGFSLGWNDQGIDRLTPTFDASRGYTIDIPTGAVHAIPPLGNLLQVLGARVSRDNPTFIETEIGLGADLGVVKIDRARVRVGLNPFSGPTLTALGASIDVGVLKGGGYLAIDAPTGNITGSLDVTLADPLNLRVQAGLSIQHVDDVLGVFVEMELDLPVPILLGATGLGIYGFLGGVGVNMRRDEHPDDTIPALAWLQRQGGDPLKVTGWVAKQGSWAFAIGALLGTTDGGFIVHLKGVLMVELPGPRILLVMKADILSLPPSLSDPSQQATILAVVDIDIGAGTITIGLVVDYSVISLVSIHVPVQGYFTFSDPPEWFLDIGSYSNPVTVSVFDAFTGSGYLMLHGNGITPYPPFPDLATGGFTIAVGFHVDLIWGDTSVNLYLKVGAGFDAIISFSPFAIAGRIQVEGELKLFIISIGASAELDVIAVPDSSGDVQTWVHGEVCGHVDFFFFSVSGCVSFELGSSPTITHDPQPLVTGVQLVSRSPALVEGSGSDRSIDGVLTKAQEIGSADPAADPVPLDAIPVVSLDVTPVLPAGFAVLGAPPLASPGTPGNAWAKRGSLWWRYTLESVTLTGALGPGQTPSTWWSRAVTVDPAEGSTLALLSWLPTATPRAIPYGQQLTTDVHERWGSVCDAAAPPSSLLFTFDDCAPGPSVTGWRLSGTPWPDPPGTVRSSAPNLRMDVGEQWRCGIPDADNRRGIDPARVIADVVPCQPSDSPVLVAQNPGPSGGAVLSGPGWLAAASSAVSNGSDLSGLRAAVRAQTWDPVMDGQKLCPGAILRSPFGDLSDPTRHSIGFDKEIIEAAWEQTGFKPGPVLDAVRFTAAGGLSTALVMVAVPRELLQNELVFRSLAADGSELARVGLTGADVITSAPGRWRDPAGPWWRPFGHALAVAQRVLPGAVSRFGGYAFALVKVDVPPATMSVEIGWDPARVKQTVPSFYVIGLETVLTSDEVRYSWDDTTQTSEQKALSAALSAEEDDHALLLAGTPYQVDVVWHAEWIDAQDQPVASASGTVTPAVTQSFTFGTEAPAAAPLRLDPWVLSTTPAAEEKGIFCDDKTRIVFATQKVVDLFAGYGDTLELRMRSASGNHPQPGGPRAATGAIASLTLNPVAQAAGALRLMTPWEQAVRESVLPNAPCVGAGSRDSHSVVEIDYPLEPCTDYLLDVVRVAADHSEVVVLRRGFTTGRFRSLAELAATFAGTRVEHAAVTANPFATLAQQPTGDTVDAAFAIAGLDRPEVPRLPRIRTLWTSDGTPQPVAVVIEAAEPLWRSHPIPTQVNTGNPRDPSGLAWRDVDTNYLRVERDPSSTAAVSPYIVQAPGAQRGVVLLPPGQRGTQLVLRLARDADPLLLGSAADAAVIATIDLTAAPWEDLDA